MSEPTRVLVVEDDEATRMLLSRLLAYHDYAVQTCCNAREAFELACSHTPQVLITDWLLQDGQTGLDVARELRSQNSDLHVVFLTGMPLEKLADALRHFDRYRIIEKSTSIELLLNAIQPPALKVLAE